MMISNFYILLWMIFNHVIDDYFLQGILATLKQKDYWIGECSKKGELFNKSIYKYDYFAALFMHSFSWTFMIMLPLVIYTKFTIDPIAVLGVFAINLIIHFVTDHAKANWKVINLCTDQFIHIIQIFATWLVFIFA